MIYFINYLNQIMPNISQEAGIFLDSVKLKLLFKMGNRQGIFLWFIKTKCLK